MADSKKLMSDIMAAHMAKIGEPAAAAAGAVTPADLNALRDELKVMIVSMLSSLGSTMVSTISATATPMMTVAASKAQDGANAAMKAEVQSIIDDGVSRMQALTARVMDVLIEDRKEDAAEAKQEAAERKLLLQAVAALAKPRKRTGIVKLPSGMVEMTVTETVQ